MIETSAQGDQLLRFRGIMACFREALVGLQSESAQVAEFYPELARRFNAVAWHLSLVVELLEGTTSGDTVPLGVETALIEELYFARALHGSACARFIREGIKFLLRLGFEAADFGIQDESCKRPTERAEE